MEPSMTKSVRIENADAGTSFRVVIYKETLQNGKIWVRDPSPIEHLQYPAQMVTVVLSDSVRFVVMEGK